MTVALTERFFFPLPAPIAWNVFGQSVTGAGAGGTPGFTLISYLTDPLPVNSRLDYVLLCHQDADEFVWTFSNPNTNLVSKRMSGDTTMSFTSATPGLLLAQVVVRKAGAALATLSLTQTLSRPGTKFENLVFDLNAAGGAGADMLFALREICEELKPYIDDAAAGTGPNGIPARLLAAVLFMEAWGRPKDGSPKAVIIRERLQGEEYNPRTQAIEESLKRHMGMSVGKLHLHDIREEELELIRSFFNEFESLDEYDPRRLEILYAGKKSLGVGQIAQTTAAMTGGLITWRELAETTKATVLDQIETDYRALPFTDLLSIFNSLRFPKTNILLAATLLAKIKNRAHRFPTMTSRDVLGSAQAIGIIATEYNRGGFDTPLATMKNNGNGDRAVKYVLAAKDTIGLTRFFPDPP